jgi:hypothetical protein
MCACLAVRNAVAQKIVGRVGRVIQEASNDPLASRRCKRVSPGLADPQPAGSIPDHPHPRPRLDGAPLVTEPSSCPARLRLAYAFSKKLENNAGMVALYFMYDSLIGRIRAVA